MERAWRPHVPHHLFQVKKQEIHSKKTQGSCSSVKLQVNSGISCPEMLWMIEVKNNEGAHE